MQECHNNELDVCVVDRQELVVVVVPLILAQKPCTYSRKSNRLVGERTSRFVAHSLFHCRSL